jgi:hypothetical protein
MLHTISHTFQWGVRKGKKKMFFEKYKKDLHWVRQRKKIERKKGKIKALWWEISSMRTSNFEEFSQQRQQRNFSFLFRHQKNFFYFSSFIEIFFLLHTPFIHFQSVSSICCCCSDALTPLTSHTQQNINSSLTTVRIEDDDRVWEDG